MRELEDKATDPATAERANVWLAKAKQVIKLSNEISGYIDSAKTKFDQEKGLRDVLHKRLTKYQTDIFSIDRSIYEQFKNSLDHSYLFHKKMTRATLSAFQSDLKTFEHQVIVFCSTKVGTTDGEGFFDSYSAIVGQNSNNLKPGDLLEIRAGVGAFSKLSQPTIIIDKKPTDINEEGYVLFTKRVSTKPGKYKIPVDISYIDKITGKENVMNVDVEYTVTKPCDQ